MSEVLKKIKSTINCKLIEESQNDQYKKYSVFDDLQDRSTVGTHEDISQKMIF